MLTELPRLLKMPSDSTADLQAVEHLKKRRYSNSSVLGEFPLIFRGKSLDAPAKMRREFLSPFSKTLKRYLTPNLLKPTSFKILSNHQSESC